MVGMMWALAVSCVMLCVSAAPSSTPSPLHSHRHPHNASRHVLRSPHTKDHQPDDSYQLDDKARPDDEPSLCEVFTTSAPCRCDDTKLPPDLTCTLQGHHPVIINSTEGKFAVGTLDLSYSAVQQVDWGWLGAVSAVHTVRLQHCNLTALPDALLARLPALRVLDLAHNHLTNLTTDTLPLPLRQLDLSYNHLTGLHLNGRSRSQLRQVKAGHNRLQSITVTGGCPPRLTLLDASHNNLQQLPRPLWECLRQVRLTNNSLPDLPALSRSSQLRVVDVSRNRLTEFPQQLLSFTPRLQRLSVAGNRVQLSEGLQGKAALTTLTTLDLSDNHIHHLPPALFHLAPALTSLDLGHNHVSTLSATTFPSPAAPLLALNLSHNALHYLHAQTFHHLHSLRQLDLSHNPLLGKSGVWHVHFPEHVTTLDLSGCSLREVDYCQVTHLHDLVHLDLQGNPLVCTCHLPLLYNNYGKQNPGGGSPWQCVSNQTGVRLSVAGQPRCRQVARCPSNQHHQGLVGREVEVSVSVVLVEHNLITSWQLTEATPTVQGFRVRCLHPGEGEEEAAHTSPILDKALRSYALTGLEDGDYTVCLDVMRNRTQVLKYVCQAVKGSGPNVLIGILAGTIFLVPCVVFVIYIVVKDRAIRRKLAQYAPEIRAPRPVFRAPDGTLLRTISNGDAECDFPTKDGDVGPADCSRQCQAAESGGMCGDGQTEGGPSDGSQPSSAPPSGQVTAATQTDLCMPHLDAVLDLHATPVAASLAPPTPPGPLSHSDSQLQTHTSPPLRDTVPRQTTPPATSQTVYDSLTPTAPTESVSNPLFSAADTPTSTPSLDVYINSSASDNATDSTALLSTTSTNDNDNDNDNMDTDTSSSSGVAEGARGEGSGADITGAMNDLDTLLAELHAISK